MALSDHVTVPSRFCALQAAQQWGMGRKTHHVLANMLDTDVFALGEKKRNGTQPTVIFFSGRLERRKGVMAFPEILAGLLERGVDFQCRLAGRDTHTAPGGGSMLNWIKAQCITEVRRRLVFLGQVDKATLVWELQNADVGLYLSSYETFGYTCLEAQACGLPVVATRLGGTGEVVHDGETGLLVNPKDSREVVDALSALLGNLERLGVMKRQARKHAVSMYSHAALSHQAYDLYAGCLGKK